MEVRSPNSLAPHPVPVVGGERCPLRSCFPAVATAEALLGGSPTSVRPQRGWCLFQNILFGKPRAVEPSAASLYPQP